MKILLIEDEEKLARALKRGLEQEAFAVDVEFDGDSGLAAAEAGSYDLFIFDRMLPGEHNGVQIVEALRKQHISTPVLFLTAKDTVEDRVAGLNAGADDYLVKPFAFEELLARIHALLRRPANEPQTILSYDDLTLEPHTGVVTRAGKTIDLTAKEFALLEYLLRNQEMVVSKDSLMEHVWDFDADILPNTVEVYIGYLRNKIDKPFAKEPNLIQTRRGFGYKLGINP
jgi:DNA-binding response OmpR family regulator